MFDARNLPNSDETIMRIQPVVQTVPASVLAAVGGARSVQTEPALRRRRCICFTVVIVLGSMVPLIPMVVMLSRSP